MRASHSQGVLHYINILSIGFSARAGALMNRKLKPLGAAGYVLSVLSNVARLQHAVDPIRIDEGQLDARPAALLSFQTVATRAGA